MFFYLKIVQKLLFLPFLVDDINKLVFEESLLVSNGFGLPHSSVQLLALPFDVNGLFLEEIGPGFLCFECFLHFFVLKFVEVLISNKPLLDVDIAFFDPFCIFLGLLFGV